jgi:hypothetical protein
MVPLLLWLLAAWAPPPAVAAPVGHGHALPGWSRPSVAPLPAGWTETWSTSATGNLPDVGQPIALSSPISANIGGTPSVVVGDRRGFLYAYQLGASGNPVPLPGWPTTDGSGPIDSTPSVVSSGSGTAASILVGSGNDSDPSTGGFQAFGPSGGQQWFTAPVDPSSDPTPFPGVQAGITVGDLRGTTAAVAGSLGQVSYSLDAGSGAPLTGWPFLNTDSTHSTAALADLYGSGQNEIVIGGDQSAGFGAGQLYGNGGHLRILTASGNQVCRADTNQVIDSSPAVGGFLPGGATGAVVGTGAFFPGASDTGTLRAYDNHCRLVWSANLDGSTYSSPALSDVQNNGQLQVIEGTDQGPGASGSLYVIDAATGHLVCEAPDIGRIIGSITTANLLGGGNDILVPTLSNTSNGVRVFDGSCNQIAQLSPNLGVQNSPLVTQDPNGTVGITLAGYVPSAGANSPAVGEIDHYEIANSNGGAAIGGSAWPMFHHDEQLSGNAGGTTAPGSIPACSIPSATLTGYNLVAADGGIFSFPSNAMPFCGSTGAIPLNAPIVGMAMSPATGGYWLVASDGGIFAFGGAGFYGSTGAIHLNAPVVGMAATPDGGGYWLVASDGGIFAFGDAAFSGSMGGSPLNKPVVGISATADGLGYRLVASDGGIFSFGDAAFQGSTGAIHLNAPIVAAVTDLNTGGYWLVASDGGIFAFGAPFYGSMGGQPLVRPIVGMSATDNGSGYRMVAADGGIFSFGALFYGSTGGLPLNAPVVGMSGF